MATVVKNNMAAIRTLNVLNVNSSELEKSLAKVSSGQKINSAKDDSASFCISEKMREQIRTLEQDNQNVQNGSALFKIADGGINSIVEELRNLKELAINSANDTNTDVDRLTIQKEFTQKMANINDIATTTNYNGKTLLDGSYFRKTITKEPAPIEIVTGNEITQDGVYILTANSAGLDITIFDNVKNVKIIQEDSDTTLKEVHIFGPSTGSANLWIDGLNINNETEKKSIIKFQGADNVLTFEGTNLLTNGAEYLTNDHNFDGATINIGDGLTIEGKSDATIKIHNYENPNNGIQGTCVGIGIDDTESSKNEAYLTINSGNYDITVEYDGAAIGTNYAGGLGNININGGTFNLKTEKGAGIGIGAGGNQVKTITIGAATIIATSTYGAGVGSGTDDTNGKVGKIIIGDGANITATSTYGAGIGAGNTHNVDELIISPKATISSTGYHGNFDETTSLANLINNNLCDGVTGVVKNISKATNSIKADLKNMPEPTNGSYEVTEFNPLKIHHGTKANQAINFFINDMHTKSLGTKKLLDENGLPLSEIDLARYDALSYDEKLQSAWLETLELASEKTLDDISVTTQKNSNVAIRVLDGALEYALNEATQVGSYLQRLDYTDINIMTIGENVQAAESTIRDADMAKEMTAYTKNNVLLQSAQAMLAQANQNSSAVLSLLQ